MKHLLTIISCFVALSMSAQVPGYVPQDGLVAWYDFQIGLSNQVDTTMSMVLFGDAQLENGVLDLSAAYSWAEASGLPSEFEGNPDFTVVLFLRRTSEFDDGATWGLGGGIDGPCCITQNINSWNSDQLNAISIDLWGISTYSSDLVYSNSSANVVSWTKSDGAFAEQQIAIYVDQSETSLSNLRGVGEYIPTLPESGKFFLGKAGDEDDYYAYVEIYACGLFSRPLTFEEHLEIYSGISDVFFVCSDEGACNYQVGQFSNNESCEYGCLNCGPGTVWDDSLSQCLPSPSICNEGTYWDDETQTCMPINSCPQDLDFDGVVGVNDLMNLLSAFGTPCDPPVAEWTCGDPVSYHGYDYETVFIGEQCWFAENSRFIPEVFPASDYSMSQPRCHVYGYNGSAVEEAVLTAEYGGYGALYNFQAVQQWAVCPTGWHVPSDEDWMGLELTLGILADSLDVVGYRGCNIGDQLKSESLWNGTNQSGMNMLPGGGTVDSGEFVFLEERGWFWSSTEAPQQAAWFRQLESNQNGIYRAHWNQNQEGGKSIRCIKD